MSERPPRVWNRANRALWQANRQQGVIRAVQEFRRLLLGPGEVALAETGRRSDRVARLVMQAADGEPTAVRELGLTALHAWQVLARKAPSDGTVTIMFTDLVGFSTWALDAGDDQVLRLLREFFKVTSELVTDYGGTVVKSLGDGVMVSFPDASAALDAGAALSNAVSAVNCDGYRPMLRVGLHRGKPRRVGRDYVGVDVNIAARIADAAGAGEVLASAQALAPVDRSRYVTRSRRFRAKGTPKGLPVYLVIPRHN